MSANPAPFTPPVASFGRNMHEEHDRIATALGLPKADFSSDIGEAWKIVNALQDKGYWLTLDFRSDASGLFVPRWHADFMRGDSDYGGGAGDTAPQAIVAAALNTIASCK